MSSQFDFDLGDIPVPSSGLLRLPVADDGPPGTAELPLALNSSLRNAFSASESPERDAQRPKNVSRDHDVTPARLEADQKPPNVGGFSKSSVLGSELAKKRLQAFCIQKKQPGSCSSPTSSSKQTTNTVLTSPLLLSKFQGSLKKPIVISKTNPLEECAEKAKNLPKKNYKKVTEYEKSRTTMTEILELKKEEERKLALIKLGVPLGLVPGNTSVKGLTPKPMPTKAMPPIKNFLDPQQVESLLKKADMMVNNDDSSFKFPFKNEVLLDNKHKSSRRRSRDRSSRSTNSRHSENYRRNDSRRDRSNRDHNRRRHDSHSTSKYRDSSSSHNRHKSRDKSTHLSRNENIKSFQNNDQKQNTTIICSNNESIIEMNNMDEMTNKCSENKETEAIVTNENNIVNFDHFSIESLNENSVEKKNELEAEITLNDDENVINKESKSIYDKFLKEKFVPFPSISDIPTDDKNRSPSPRYFSPNLNSDLVLQFKHENNDKIDLYSPGMESSRESPMLIKNTVNMINPELPPTKISNAFLEPTITKKIDFSHECWLDIDKLCQPNKHFSSICFKLKTSSHPTLIYSENLSFCDCSLIRNEIFKTLASKTNSLLSSMNEENLSIIGDSTRHWYPSLDKVFVDIGKVSEIASNWDTDDSLSQPSQNMAQTQKYKKDEYESDSVIDSTLNFKSLNIFNNSTEFRDTSTVANSNLYNEFPTPINTQDNVITTSSLDSEYEKFMEAVWPQIGDDGNNSYRSSTHSNTQEVNMDSPNNLKLSTFDLSNSQDMFVDHNEISSQQKNSEQAFTKDETMSFFNVEKCEPVTIVTPEVPAMICVDISNDNINKTTIKTGDENWNIENCDDQKNNKFSSSKLNTKRKGHAKISSRRKKGKSKTSPKNHHKSSSSSSSSSNSSSDSKSSSSSSSSSNSSVDSSDSSDDTSSLSSSNSSSSSDTNSNSDFSDSSDSTDSSDEKLLKSIKKHKNKKFSKKIYAKAKKIVKKIENKKKMKKMKELIAQEKKEIIVPKEIVNEFSLKDDNEVGIIDNNTQIDNSNINKKRKLKVKKNKNKHKKRKRSVEEDSYSYSSSDSEELENVESRTKRIRDVSEDSQEHVPNLKKKKNTTSVESTNDIFDMNTLLNIKNEKVSDDEDSLNKLKAQDVENKPKSPFKQEIINAKELQNSFLEVNKTVECISTTIVKTEPCQNSKKTNVNDIESEKCSLYDESEIVLSIPKLDTDEIILGNSDNPNCTDNTQNMEHHEIHSIIPVISNGTFKINELNDIENSEINMVTPIERAESDLRSNQLKKLHRERKTTRWGAVTDREPLSKINNSALIEVPIQEFDSVIEDNLNLSNNSQLYNVYENTESAETENKVYKIPTISSRNIISQKAFTDPNNYEDYTVFSNEKTHENSNISCVNYDEKKSPSRKISLDDRINMALQFQGDAIFENSIIKDKSPEKGILIVGGSRVTRVDPRITRAKKVSFADGFVPGQDSDCENEPLNTKVTQMSLNISAIKKKKKRSFSGHAYPCPETWPDYHPKWDRLPPPPPPPGSPPPELCDRTNFPLLNVNTITSPLSRISRLPNAVVS